jgi:hypothetical protein
MRRSTPKEWPAVVACGAVVVAVVIGASGCATGTSAVAGSTYRKGSVYRSATAYVGLAPDDAFEPAVELLLEREDVEITDLKEADNRCKAVAGDHQLTLRVIESGTSRSRVSVLVGGGSDPEANDELARELLTQICERLDGVCE